MSRDGMLLNDPTSGSKNVPGLFDVFGQICGTVQIILDAEGRILSFNASAADITGYSEAEAIAHAPWELLFDQEYIMQAIEYFKDLPRRQKLLQVTLPICCRNGRRRHIKWSIYSIGGEESEPRYIVISGIDITAEIELKDSDRRMRTIFHQQLLDLEKQNRHLQKISRFDHLTGIYNRRFFDEALHEKIDRQQHRDVPISLLMCDVDFFKQYNDTYGHVAGDAVLKKIGQLLSEFTRSDTDIAARYGGEEFTLILPLTGRQEARELAGRIQRAIAEAGILHGRSAVSPYITLSIGIATSKPSSLPDARSFVNLVDRQLYRAKRNGRNCIISISHFGPPSTIQ